MGSKVLLVEDNRTNLELMLYLLRAFGHQAEGAASAIDGLKAAINEKFDIVLCDVLMPDMDGIEFVRHFKMNDDLKATPVVAVTALAMVGDRERLLNAGFDGYIAKPIDPDRFAAQVEGFLHGDRPDN